MKRSAEQTVDSDNEKKAGGTDVRRGDRRKNE